MGYSISKKGKHYINKCQEYCFNKLSKQKSIRLIHFAHSFISNHITFDNYKVFYHYAKQKGII